MSKQGSVTCTVQHAYRMGWVVGERKAQNNPLPYSSNPFKPSDRRHNDAWAQGYSDGYDYAVTPATKFECLECGHKFNRKNVTAGVEIRCPKCYGYDVDLAL